MITDVSDIKAQETHGLIQRGYPAEPNTEYDLCEGESHFQALRLVFMSLYVVLRLAQSLPMLGKNSTTDPHSAPGFLTCRAVTILQCLPCLSTLTQSNIQILKYTLPIPVPVPKASCAMSRG